ncbi:MAG TPA: hypothetical protein VHF92_18150 [Geodermatophilus sp.]|nr:hypothetical protein [Geodermatophilus sp.]
MPWRTSPAVRRLLDRRLPALRGAGPRVEDAVATAADLATAGYRVAFDHVPPSDAADPAGELRELIDRVHDAGLAARSELTVPVELLGAPAAEQLVVAAQEAEVGVALAGPPELVLPLAGRFPEAGVVVPAARPEAEDHCRALAGGRVRLVGGRGAAVDLAFVRCLNVLMAGSGHPGIGTTDPRLVAIAGERAAWNDRSPDSWEYVMTWRVRTEQQQRLLAGGYAVRVALPSGAGAVRPVLERLAGRR